MDYGGSIVVGRGVGVFVYEEMVVLISVNMVDESPTLGTMDLDREAGNGNKGFRVVSEAQAI